MDSEKVSIMKTLYKAVLNTEYVPTCSACGVEFEDGDIVRTTGDKGVFHRSCKLPDSLPDDTDYFPEAIARDDGFFYFSKTSSNHSSGQRVWGWRDENAQCRWKI